ncbi:MAG: hypothetical protein ACHQ52_03815 [Candidatus Eisenbacteria bacterium]
MRRPAGFLATAATCAALIAAVAPAGATSPAPPLPSEPRLVIDGPVHAGDQIELRWDAMGRAEELELLLSLDGGRTWRLRVSPELPGSSTRYLWRVPNLASAGARVRLRVRIDEREIESAPSEPFVIECDPTRPLSRALVSEGGWWSGFDGHGVVGPGWTGTREPSLGAPHAITASEEGPRLALTPPPLTARVTLRSAPSAPAPRDAHTPGSPAMGFPLRM